MTTAPVSKRRRDWFAILRALARADVSMDQIARICGRAPSTVWRWQDAGAEPKESDARIVLALLAKHVPDEYARQQREFSIRLDIATGDKRARFVESM